MNRKYDVIVIGAGHAGCEAALAAARMGAATLIFVVKFESIGRMSCNPSLGGPAKGHLAREIDALGGEIGKIGDMTGIQFRMLNRKKGPAVWAPRSQNDRLLYSVRMRQSLENQSGLDIKESIIDEILVDNGRVTGVRSHLGEEYFAPRVIVATGTFLRGAIHVGDVNFSGGRSGEPAANVLTSSLQKLGLQTRRFKTGTPPRVDLRTVDLSKLEEQPGDPNPVGFTFYRDIELKNLVSCWLTYTNEHTHKIIQDNLKRSSLYGGNISGIGPRYCPSIEDKIVKFTDKPRHQLFIEPEGTETFEAYVNGISNSLPPHVQKQALATVEGLEHAKIIRYAYAIEYDIVIPSEITLTLETRTIEGLYLAGQINGTSGYEEAAAQGIAAGINAVLTLDGNDPVIFDRAKSYIGVLIDDLVTRGTEEPYRLFTSRAEYRLFLRQDNADERLMPLGYKLGLVDDVRWQRFRNTLEIRNRELDFLKTNNTIVTGDLREPVKFYSILKRPEIEFDDLVRFGYKIPQDVTPAIMERITIACKYEGYLQRQLEDIRRFEEMEEQLLPDDIDYMSIETIAWEAREKLKRKQPRSLGQASRISGVNRTDITALMVYIRKQRYQKDNS